MSDVIPATPAHRAAWLRLRCALWPGEPPHELAVEVDDYYAGRSRDLACVLVAVHDERVAGVAELDLRPYAEGCASDRVAYLEAWYVDAGQRRRGVGAALMRAAEAWARSIGCTEFASDTQADNAVGAAAHAALGFTEVEIIRCYAKRLV